MSEGDAILREASDGLCIVLFVRSLSPLSTLISESWPPLRISSLPVWVDFGRLLGGAFYYPQVDHSPRKTSLKVNRALTKNSLVLQREDASHGEADCQFNWPGSVCAF